MCVSITGRIFSTEFEDKACSFMPEKTKSIGEKSKSNLNEQTASKLHAWRALNDEQ